MSKKKKLFTESLKPKKTELFRVAEDHFVTSGLLGVEEELVSDFAFYSEDVKRSKILPDYKFTNYVSANVSQDVKIRFQELASDPSIIQDRASGVDRNIKIDKCIALYVNLGNEDPLIFKSTLHTSVGVPTTVRVFSKVDLVRQDSGKNKALFRIILIDPFHLVIPSQHKGIEKGIMEDQVFNENRNNTICMSEWLKAWFD